MKGILLSIIVWSTSCFYSFNQTFSLHDSTFTVGDVYRPFPKILFNYDQASLRPESLLILDTISDFLKIRSELKVEIGVHLDTRASELVSRRLDSGRAKAIKDYFISKGIDSSRLTSKGYWKNNPLISEMEINKFDSKEDIEEAHAKNRRVEFKIIEITPIHPEIIGCWTCKENGDITCFFADKVQVDDQKMGYILKYKWIDRESLLIGYDKYSFEWISDNSFKLVSISNNEIVKHYNLNK